MKLEGKNSPPGEFGSKALVQTTTSKAWTLSTDYYFSLDAAQEANKNLNVKWPVELYDDAFCYVPDKCEWEEPTNEKK